MYIRKNTILQFQKRYNFDKDTITKYAKQYQEEAKDGNRLEEEIGHLSYSDFVKYFQVDDDNEICKNVFKYNAEKINSQDMIFIPNICLQIIGVMELSKLEKFQLSFMFFGESSIQIDSVLYIIQVVGFKHEIQTNKILGKIQYLKSQKEYQQQSIKPDQVTLDQYENLIKSFPLIFSL